MHFKIPFPPSFARSKIGFFSSIYCGNLVKFLEVNLTILRGPTCAWIPSEFLTLSCLHWTSNNSSVTVQAFLLRHWFPWWFLLVSPCPIKPGLPVFTCLSLQSRGQHFALGSPLSFIDQKESADFSDFSPFYFLLGWNCDFQDCHVCNQKTPRGWVVILFHVFFFFFFW